MYNSIHFDKRSLYTRVLPATVMGNALEFFDFTLYGIFAVTIGKLFFPLDNPTASLIASWAAFAAGFLMRPLGALVFGYLGDTFGRKFSLSGTVLLTGIPTLIIGFLPSYAEIGLLAPMILVLCRLLQGFCTGGEYNGAAIFALEHFGKLKPGTVGGIITGSCVIGALLATYSGYLISNYGQEDMWRVPFICGSFISLIGFAIRFYINETPEFSNLLNKQQKKSISFIQIYTTYVSSAWLSFMVGSLNGALSYTLFAFLNLYMSKYLGVELTIAMQYNLLGLACFMVFSPIAGYYLDSVGSDKAMFTAISAVIIGVTPIYFLIQSLYPPYILLGQALLGMITAGIAGAGHGYMQNLFPTEARYRGISINFCIGMALCGGTAPMILTYFIESLHYTLYMPALYLMSIAFIFFLTIVTLSKTNKRYPYTMENNVFE